MNDNKLLNLDGLPEKALPVVRELADDIITAGASVIESLVLAGSILTQDYIPGISDINSVIVLRELEQDFLDGLASLGKKFGRKNVRAPLIITTEHLNNSIDVFPIEFLEIKLIHKTIYGSEIFSGLNIEKPMLRLQCERELKAKMIQLSRGYISASGDRDILLNLVNHASSGFYPLFRAILFMTGQNVPVERTLALDSIESHCKINLGCLKQIHNMRSQKKPSIKANELKKLFSTLYKITHDLSVMVDELQI